MSEADDDEHAEGVAAEEGDESDASEDRPLSSRESAFAREYVVDRNGTAAAVRAGYAPGPGARVQAVRLLARANVRKAIADIEQGALERTEITLDTVLNEFKTLAYAKPHQFKAWGPNGVKAKTEALKALGQHVGMFTGSDEIKVRRAVEQLLERVKPGMSAEAYGQFVAALGEEMGIADLGEDSASGGQAAGGSPTAH